jgi:hypothetical protein
VFLSLTGHVAEDVPVEAGNGTPATAGRAS